MELGTFSVSLAVKDMTASRDFYEKLGFTMVAGDGETWTIVTNGANTIGLFQGMLDSNILTFNPGWEGLGRPANAFTDVRELPHPLQRAALCLPKTQPPRHRRGLRVSKSPTPMGT